VLWVGVFLFVVIKAIAAPAKHSVYPVYAQSAREWVSAGPFTSIISIQHLPYFADLVAPFAALPDRIGAAGWAVFGFLAYATGLRAFLAIHLPDAATGRTSSQTALLCGLLVGSGSLANHQSNVLIVGCWLWAMVAVRSRWWWSAAALMAISAFKMYTLAPTLVLAALYPRQLSGRLAVTIAAVLALPYVFHPAAAVEHRFLAMVEYLCGGDHYRIFHYQTLYETWRQYIGPVEVRWLLPLQALAGIVIPLLVWAFRRSGGSYAEAERHGFFLACVWCVSFGPSIEPQTYLLVAPTLGWWLASCLRQNRAAAIAVVVVIGLAGSPVYSLGPAVRDAIIGSKLPFIAMMIFYFGLIASLVQRTNRLARIALPMEVLPVNKGGQSLVRHDTEITNVPATAIALPRRLLQRVVPGWFPLASRKRRAL